MKYVFNVPQDRPKVTIPEGLIPLAIKRAEEVKPCEEIKLFWEGSIMRDLENHDVRFSWRNFISSITP